MPLKDFTTNTRPRNRARLIKRWVTAKGYGKDYVKEYTDLIEQPLKDYLIARFYHRTLCGWLCQRWLPTRFHINNDLRCYDLSQKNVKTIMTLSKLLDADDSEYVVTRPRNQL